MANKSELNRRISTFYDDYHRGRNRQPNAWMQTHYWPAFVGRTLEVGGGTLYPNKPDYAIVDLSMVAARRALERSIPAFVADGSHLPFADHAFDTLACYDVLEHVTEPAAFLAEMCRVSAKRLVIAGPNFIGGGIGHLDRRLPGRLLRFFFEPASRLQELKNPHLSFDNDWAPDRDAVTAANAAWVAEQVEKNGFKVIQLRTWEIQWRFLNHVPALRCLGPFMLVIAER